MWGKRERAAPVIRWRRFTPTGVGKTRSAAAFGSPLKVHPHRCGENVLKNASATNANGSPPQVWGKQMSHRCLERAIRFTPTGVGKTIWRRGPYPKGTVHPHRCGENVARRIRALAENGSPPQVWGKLHTAAPYDVIRRFTPTGVGKTSSGTLTS